MNLVKTGRWIFVDITLLYVPPVYYVYYGQLCWIKLSESESDDVIMTLHSSICGQSDMYSRLKISLVIYRYL